MASNDNIKHHILFYHFHHIQYTICSNENNTNEQNPRLKTTK